MLGIMRKYKQSIVIKVVFGIIVLSFIGTIFLVWGKGGSGEGRSLGFAAKVEGNDQLNVYNEYQQRATEMVLSGKTREAFAIEKEENSLRDRYGRNTFGQSCLLARRLIEGGVRFVTVNYGGWDHHAKVFENLDKKLP